jgi:hypothetical protein
LGENALARVQALQPQPRRFELPSKITAQIVMLAFGAELSQSQRVAALQPQIRSARLSRLRGPRMRSSVNAAAAARALV